MATRDRDLEDVLNRMNPAANMARLGTLLEEMITQHNDVLAKLDADAGVTDTNYAATLSITSLKDRL